jgi:hypothetical protein
MRFFLAGIMQGSHLAATIHNQDYRARVKRLIETYIPGAKIYDPLSDHSNSLDYDDQLGHSVFMHHNRLCGEVDVLLAIVPEASMGTAIEMWEAHRNGRAVISVSPMKHNWTIKFLSHEVYADIDQLEAALQSGALAARLQEIRGN